MSVAERTLKRTGTDDLDKAAEVERAAVEHRRVTGQRAGGTRRAGAKLNPSGVAMLDISEAGLGKRKPRPQLGALNALAWRDGVRSARIIGRAGHERDFVK